MRVTETNVSFDAPKTAKALITVPMRDITARTLRLPTRSESVPSGH
jgi:hypothetical protein